MAEDTLEIILADLLRLLALKRRAVMTLRIAFSRHDEAAHPDDLAHWERMLEAPETTILSMTIVPPRSRVNEHGEPFPEETQFRVFEGHKGPPLTEAFSSSPRAAYAAARDAVRTSLLAETSQAASQLESIRRACSGETGLLRPARPAR